MTTALLLSYSSFTPDARALLYHRRIITCDIAFTPAAAARRRRRGLDGLRPIGLALTALIWLAAAAAGHPLRSQPVAGAGSEPSRPSSRAAAAPAPSVGSSGVAAFRLGTAARPFGWATAIGDLNVDGAPDLVVADRTSRRAGQYGYRIQFSVSGLAPRDFAFESSDEAVTVRMSDVDHDDDLDVIVNAVPSREVVGIWLNDGHGRFSAADVRRFASEARLQQSVAAVDASADPSAQALTPRRAEDGVPAFSSAAQPLSRPVAVAMHRVVLLPATGITAVAPRGPPSLLS